MAKKSASRRKTTAKPKRPPHTFTPFSKSLALLHDRGAREWADVEGEFLEVVSEFDFVYGKGGKDSGWYQLKAKYFNDVVVTLVENATGQSLATRSKKQSVLFSEIDIDMCFPVVGRPLVAAEVKALGTPPHPGNKFVARKAQADLHKRVREVAFTSMDIKAAHAKPGAISSFQSWVETAEPAYSSFWAMRVADESDLSKVRSILASLRSYCNGVGAVIYEASTSPTTYCVRQYPEFSMDRAIRDFTQRIISST